MINFKEAEAIIKAYPGLNVVAVKMEVDDEWEEDATYEADVDDYSDHFIHYAHSIKVYTDELGAAAEIVVPSLVDVELYGEWLELMVRNAFSGDSITEYRRFETTKYFNPQYSALYVSDTHVTNELDNGLVEFYYADAERQDGMIRKCEYVKSPKGFVLRTNKHQVENSSYWKKAWITGDLYSNPSNKQYDFLLPTPKSCYCGVHLYYHPDFANFVLVKMHEEWVWVSVIHILNNPPTYLKDEASLLQNFIG